MADTNTSAGSSFMSNVVAIIASIVVIAIVIWGLVHLASMSNSWFSSLFSFATARSASTIQITAPATAISDTPFNLSWKYTPTVPGTYAILYQCRTGLSLKTTAADGRLIAIPCGAGYTVASSNQSAVMTPTLSGVTTASLPISVFFMPSSTSSTNLQAHGDATVTVNARSTTQTNTTAETPATTPAPTYAPNLPAPTVTKPTQTTQPVTTYRSPADISVRIIGVGVIDPATRSFVNRAPLPGEAMVLEFDIKNVGGTVSGPYTFHAQLPTFDHYIYVSPSQRPLGAGDHVINILRFSSVAQTGGTASVNVAAIGLDANNANNSASQWVAGNSYVTPQYQYGNTYNYGSTYPTAYYPSQSYTSYYTPTTPTPAYNQYYVGYNQPTYSGY